jgi:hypothetical protein
MRRGWGEHVEPKKKRPRKKKESARATKDAEDAEDEDSEQSLVQDLTQISKKLAELAKKKGKKKVGSTAEETGETNEVEEEDVEIDPVGTRVVMLDVLVRSHVRAAMAESWMSSQIRLQIEGAALRKRSSLSCGNYVAGWEFE